jgi:hypothetical protein
MTGEYALCECQGIDNENCKKKVLGNYDEVTVYEEICKTCNKLSHHSADGSYEEQVGHPLGPVKRWIQDLLDGRPESTQFGIDTHPGFVFCEVKKWIDSKQHLEMILVQKGYPKNAADILSELEEKQRRFPKDSRDPEMQASHNQVIEALKKEIPEHD